MERERRLVAAVLVALLASGLWYVWEEPGDGASGGLNEPVTTETGGEEKQKVGENDSVRTDTGEGEPSVRENDARKDEEEIKEQQEPKEDGDPQESATEQPQEPQDTPTQPPLAKEDQEPSTTEAEYEPLYHNVCPPESAGKDYPSSNSTSEVPNTVFVVNGLSSIGARVAYMLSKDHRWETVSLSSSRHRLCGDQLVWYRQDMLREKGVHSVFVDWSNSNAVGTVFKARRPSHVIVVPPGVDGTSSSRYTLDASMWAGALHDFVSLLETLKTVSPDTRLTLVSVSKSVANELEVVPVNSGSVSIIEILVGAFELTLSTYHTLYQIPFSVLRLKGQLHGPWTHSALKEDSKNQAKSTGCFIDDFVAVVYSALTLNTKCVVLDFGTCDRKSSERARETVGTIHLTSQAIARAKTDRWRSEYRAMKKSQVVLTSYFTDPGFTASPDKFRRLQSWVESVSQHGLEAVVLHDGLDSGFVSRCKSKYHQLESELVSLPFDFGSNSSYRQSLLAFASYLEHRTDIGRVLLMDLDQTLNKNVFPAMEVLGDWLYSDFDATAFRETIAQTVGGELAEDAVIFTKSLVLGGTRQMVLATLYKIAECSQSATALRCLTDKHFVRHSFTGWPFYTAVS